MFEMPKFVIYPEIKDIAQRPELNGIFCYLVEPYFPGYSVVIKIQNREVGSMVGNWSGHILSKNDPDVNKALSIVPQFASVMRKINIPEAQYYISKSGDLVDVRIGQQKYLGPGMLRDIFNGVVPIQSARASVVLTAEKVSELKHNKDKVILKPSLLRMVNITPTLAVPCYAKLGF